MDDLVGEFINETSESLAALERALADHARTPMTADGWDMAYRLMHTIKGTCGFLGFSHMEQVADRSEKLLAHARDHAPTPSAQELSAIRSAMAQISAMMDHLAAHGSEPETAPEPKAKPKPEAKSKPVKSVPVAEAPPPAMARVSAKLHHTPEPPEPMVAAQPESAPTTALTAPEPGPREQVGFATLATLVMLRNQLRDMGRSKSDGRLSAATATLDTLIADLKQKLLPRPKQSNGPRIARALLVECGGQRFALPHAMVREVARIDPTERLGTLPDGAMISLQGSWLPRVSLAARLGQGSTEGEAYAVVLEMGDTRIALGVEHLGELEELVIQPVPKLLRNKPLYNGAAILGDGSPCLLLDAAALLAQRPQPTLAPAAPARPITPPPMDEELPPPAAAAAPVEAATPFLLFRDGTHQPKAIPLAEVARVEHVHAADVVETAEGPRYKCRGTQLNLQLLPGCSLPASGDFPLIMLLNAPDTGIVAQRMQGIIETMMALPQSQGGPILARAAIDAVPTDIINAAHFTEAAHG